MSGDGDNAVAVIYNADGNNGLSVEVSFAKDDQKYPETVIRFIDEWATQWDVWKKEDKSGLHEVTVHVEGNSEWRTFGECFFFAGWAMLQHGSEPRDPVAEEITPDELWTFLSNPDSAKRIRKMMKEWVVDKRMGGIH